MAKSKYTKRSDGRYQANICVGYDEKGKRKKYVTVYARSEPELIRKKSEIISNVEKGTYADDKKMNVKELADNWFKTEKAVCGIRTKEMYERITYKHIIPAIGDIRLRDLKKSDVQKMINDRVDKRRTCEQIKMSTRQMLDFAMEDGLLYKNVAAKIKLPEKIKKEKRALTDLERVSILNANFTEKEKAFIYVLLYCGLRRGEMLALSKADVLRKTKKIKISNAVTFENGKPILKEAPKTENGFREIPISNDLEKVLLPYIDRTSTYYLFPNESGELMSKSTFDDFWKRIFEKINVAAGGTKDKVKIVRSGAKSIKKTEHGLKVIHGLTPHVFRHNYATLLYYADVKVKDAQYLMGHSDIKLTLDLYTHLDKKKTDVAEKIRDISAL